MVVTCVISFIIAIAVGLAEESWLWCGFVMIIYFSVTIPTIYFTKYAYNKQIRISHFLLAVFCRAENNRHYLNLGLELRPGFLGKWIEVSVVNPEGHPDVITYFKTRFLQPAIDLRTKQAERQMFSDQTFVRQQQKIEANIAKFKVYQKKSINKQEQREVQMAAIQSDPNEFSCSDLHGRPSNSSVMHSQQDMILSSAVKLASETSFNRDKS